MIRLSIIVLFLLLPLWFTAQPLQLINITGKIVTGTANDNVPYVNVIIINKHLGTISDEDGQFSITAAIGDTLLFSSMGFQSAKYIVDTGSIDHYIVQHLELDTFFLQEILIFPWDNYYAFKQAVLHTFPPKNNIDRALENFKRIEEQLVYDDDNDIPNAAAAHNIAMQRFKEDLYYRGQIRTISLLNPIAWAQFFKALKDGSLKNPNKQ